MNPRAAWMTLLALSVTTGGALADPCPTSCILGTCYTDAVKSACGRACGSYNCKTGYVTMAGSGGDYSYGGTTSAHDRYTVVGSPSPASITFHANLALDGSGSAISFNGGYAGLFGSIGDGVSPTISVSAGTDASHSYVSIHQTLSLTLQHVVGDTFELTYSAGASGFFYNSNANMTGNLSFPDLPPGYGVISCQGLMAGPYVPVRPVSWGSLKVTYR